MTESGLFCFTKWAVVLKTDHKMLFLHIAHLKYSVIWEKTSTAAVHEILCLSLKCT